MSYRAGTPRILRHLEGVCPFQLEDWSHLFEEKPVRNEPRPTSTLNSINMFRNLRPAMSANK
jgi:hypothetical protein